MIMCDGKNFNVTNSTGGHQCYCLREKAPDPLPEAHHCADQQGLQFCDCYGTVYYGRKFDKGSNKALTFAEMMKNGWTSTLSNGDLLCENQAFDGDPDYGFEKQCFCQEDPIHEPAPPVERCALEQDRTDCVCQGTVYYGQQKCPYEGEQLSFEAMKDYNFVSRDVDGAIECSNLEFGDPRPHHLKQCFCE